MDKVPKICNYLASNQGHKETEMPFPPAPFTLMMYKVNEWLFAAIVLSTMFPSLCVTSLSTAPLGIW